MDIASPFIVVPVMAVIFLSCILYATLSGAKFHETVVDDSNAGPDTH